MADSNLKNLKLGYRSTGSQLLHVGFPPSGQVRNITDLTLISKCICPLCSMWAISLVLHKIYIISSIMSSQVWTLIYIYIYKYGWPVWCRWSLQQGWRIWSLLAGASSCTKWQSVIYFTSPRKQVLWLAQLKITGRGYQLMLHCSHECQFIFFGGKKGSNFWH